MSDQPDLFEPLRRHDPAPSAPAPEVRRRGDRLRRRRHAVQAIGAACAVALLATGGALLADGDVLTGTEPPVATQDPTRDPAPPAVRIPDSLDLTAGWGPGGRVQGPSDSVSGISGIVFCDAAPSPADVSIDHQGVLRTAPGATWARDLAVYADPGTAVREARRLVGYFEDCPRFSLDDGASYTNTAVESVPDLGDEAWAVRRTYESGGEPQVGQEVLVVVRTGTAVLVEREYSDGPGATDEAALDLGVDGAVALADQLVRTQLCLFTSGGC